ncbi:MAG: DUF3131 domain-containing protein [Candidatus Competibacteraceae bacterium]|nr:DUF3131 domain-containing protein [Candidatus Competibacteraceae bacterium]
MPITLLKRLIWLSALLYPSASVLAAASLILHDFEHLASPAPGIAMSAWTTDPDLPSGRISYRLEPMQRGESRHALYLQYHFNPGATEAIGWQLSLPDLDVSAYDHLAVWIRGDARVGFAQALKLQFKQPLASGPLGLLRQGSTVVDGITSDWQRFEIPLRWMNGIEDWTRLRQFALVLQPRRSPVTQGAYWLDDLALVKTAQPGPSIYDRVIPPNKTAWEARLGGKEAAQPYIHARLAGWPERLIVPSTELPRDDRAFLERLARDTWRGLAAFSDREHGLPLDTVRFNGSVAPERAWIGDYTNVTNIGLYLIDIIAARELGLIDPFEAQERLSRTLDSLERLETWRGFFFNYYDTTTLERTSHFVSFVDSAWLSAGLIIARNAIPALAERCARLIDREDYGVFYDPVDQLMMHGYYVHLPHRAEFNYGLLYSEARLGSLIAIGKGQVPEEHWYRMARTFPRYFDWQSQSPKRRVQRTVNGYTFPGGHYAWKKLKFVPSWGGSLFEALMPMLVLDERRYAPASLGRNATAHTAIHRRYALEHLGYPVWGLSPSSKPGEGYSEFGVRVLGVRGYRAGVVTPHAAALALMVDPAAATANLRRLAERYPILGDFGFYDAVDPQTSQIAYNYLALDQSMILIALANHLKNGVIQHYFAADPIIQRVLPLLGAERFFD